MKFFNREKIRKWGRRTMALVCALGSMLSLNIGAATAAESSADVLSDCVDGVIVLFKWDPIIDAYDFPGGEYYVAVLTEKNTYWGGTPYTGGDIYLSANDWIPYTCDYHSRTADDIFYSVGTHGSPMIFYDAAGATGCKNWDGDNHCPRLALWACDKNGSPTGAIGRDDWDPCYRPDVRNWDLNNYLGDYVNGYTKPVERWEMKDYLSYYIDGYTTHWLQSVDGYTVWWSCSHPHHDHDEYTCFCFIHNISGRDPAMRIKGDGSKLYCEREKDWGDRCYFNLWKGTPTRYSTLTRNYSISDNQTLNLNAEEEKNKGVYIPKGITLTVKKGGTLSINETVLNDGKIVVDGGTLIIQSKGSLGPFANDGMNNVTCVNNGVIIVMEGGRLYTRDSLNLAQSRLINFGTCVLGNNLNLYSSFVENRETGTIVMGYTCDAKFNPNFADVDLSKAASGSINNFKHDENRDNMYAYDTKGHYSTYGCFDNDGVIASGFDSNSDIFWTVCRDKGAMENKLKDICKNCGATYPAS